MTTPVVKVIPVSTDATIKIVPFPGEIGAQGPQGETGPQGPAGVVDIQTGSSSDGTWVIEGGTLGATQPQFTGDPLFSGNYTLIENVCTFAIDVDMDNITNFGVGQYYMKLPFAADDNLIISGGCLHDASTGDEYFIIGHVNAGSDIMTLLSTASNGKHIPFADSDNAPIKLAVADNFHIAGTYQIVPSGS